jgi:glycosyltransferase involved in cell wall biosynthesis
LRRDLRILMVTPRFTPLTGGVETHVREVADRLVRRGHDVTVLTTDLTGELPRSESLAGLAVRRVAAYPRSRDYYWAPQIHRIAAAPRWDIVHVQGVHTFVPILGMLGAIKSGTPFFLTFHTGGHSAALRARIRKLQWLLVAPLLRRAERLIAVSHFERRLFSSVPGIPRSKLLVIPNGGDLPAIDPSKAAVDPNLVLSLGRLERYKGHQRAIAAVAVLKERLPHVRLRIVGSGPYHASLTKESQRLGIEDSVVIEGVDSGDRLAMAVLLSSAAVVVLLSDYEAHAIAAIEAIALGRPVVVVDSTGLGDLVKAGLATGVPPGADASEIADAIYSELTSPTQRNVPVPTWEEAVTQLEELYLNAAR